MPNAEWTHCFLDKEAVAAKKLSQELHEEFCKYLLFGFNVQNVSDSFKV